MGNSIGKRVDQALINQESNNEGLSPWNNNKDVTEDSQIEDDIKEEFKFD